MREIKKAGQPHSIAGIQVFCLKISCSPPLPFSGISQVSLPQNAKSHDQEPTATGFSTPRLVRLLLMLPQRCWRQGQGQDSQSDGDNSHRNHCSWLAILTGHLHGDTVLLEQHGRQGSPAVPTWERCLRPAGPPPADRGTAHWKPYALLSRLSSMCKSENTRALNIRKQKRDGEEDKERGALAPGLLPG